MQILLQLKIVNKSEMSYLDIRDAFYHPIQCTQAAHTPNKYNMIDSIQDQSKYRLTELSHEENRYLNIQPQP